jgi:hypothetical protein
VHTLKALLAAGCSVLVTSYTNSAVDNILLKLLEEEEEGAHTQGQAQGRGREAVRFVRLGRPQGARRAVSTWLPAALMPRGPASTGTAASSGPPAQRAALR